MTIVRLLLGLLGERITVGNSTIVVKMQTQFLKFFGKGRTWQELYQPTNIMLEKRLLRRIRRLINSKYQMVNNFVLCLYVTSVSVTPADFRVLNGQVCSGHDLHRIEFMRHASTINECIGQCYGFFNLIVPRT